MKNKGNIGKSKQKRISTQLLMVLIPMVAAAFFLVSGFIAIRAKSVITDIATNELHQEARANAADIGSTMGDILNYYDAMADAVENAPVKDAEKIKSIMKPGLTKYTQVPNGCYLALSDKKIIDPSGWEPEPGYDPTAQDWYQTGVGQKTMTLGAPYVDELSGEMVVTASREVQLKDGRKGVMAIDISLADISAAVSQYEPGKTGKTVLFYEDVILGHANNDYIGSSYTDHSDDQMTSAIGAELSKGTDARMHTVRVGGKSYFASIDAVPNTNWVMASYVAENDVLREMNQFMLISTIITLIMVAVLSVVLHCTVGRMITKPVSNLTENITKIAGGDFTIEIPEGGNNEIGLMNNNMHDYVSQMRHTLTEIKGMADELSNEADNSKVVSGDLNNRAEEQAATMVQIQQTMDDMANAVTDLAENATELAQQVNDLTAQSESTKNTMDALVAAAKTGKEDMNAVQTNMTGVAASMQQMNDVVGVVDDSAKQIDSIIDMINSISEQTNLLSLNASIEAARAGEAGRGFAVVADEIGNLAKNSAESTKQISEIIKDITEQIAELSAKAEANVVEINRSMESVNTAGETFEQIFKNLDEAGMTVGRMITKIGNIDGIATAMAAISEEQSASTQEVSATATTLAAGAEQVAEHSKNVDHSASAVSDSSVRIEGLINQFTV